MGEMTVIAVVGVVIVEAVAILERIIPTSVFDAFTFDTFDTFDIFDTFDTFEVFTFDIFDLFDLFESIIFNSSSNS